MQAPALGSETPVTWSTRSAVEVARELRTDPSAGLSAAEAARRLQESGRNELPQQKPPGIPDLVLSQLKSVLIYILFAAAALSLALGDVLETIAILAIAVLNVVLGVVQEYRAERALRALQALSAPMATVRRDDTPKRVPAAEVVPGDLLVVEAGDVVAADARIVEASSLATNESMLTGESLPVEKSSEACPPTAQLAELSCMLFQGTQVVRGRALAIVVETGERTQLGQIASRVAGRERGETPLQRQLAEVGRYLVGGAGALCLIVFVAGLLRGIAFEDMLLTAASLAVAAIPEGLPAASTAVLALGVQRMASRRAIVRRLSSVETLGAVNIIFTDKTGTLTRNEMQVRDAWAATDEVALLEVAALCNNASLGDEGSGPTGDPTEIALLAYVRDRRPDVLEQTRMLRREAEVPFSAARAMMTVVISHQGTRAALTKGATERLLPLCSTIGEEPATEELRQEVLRRARDMASGGIRVLGFARRRLGQESAPEDIERDLSFVGLIGMADPLRDEARPSIEQARAAGIRVVILTGDQRETAASIAKELGLPGEVREGKDVDGLDEDGLLRLLKDVSVFARVSSEHKLRFIDAARGEGDIAAMTGDGINDAPALQAADIGVAMGEHGTDVAREAADMVLADDNFSTIIAAVEEGRSIHGNMRRFIHFLLSCNAAEIIVVFLALTAAGVTVLSPLQILYVNLLTDGLPALALGVEPATRSLMNRPPRPRGQGLVSATSLVPVLGMGGLIALAALAAYAIGDLRDSDVRGKEMAFATLVGAQLAASLVFRSESETFLRLRRNDWLFAAIAASVASLLLVFYIPFLQDAFDTHALPAVDWLIVGLLSLLPLVAGEAAKASGLLQRFGWAPEGVNASP